MDKAARPMHASLSFLTTLQRSVNTGHKRCLNLTAVVQKNIRAGVPKTTINKNKPLTYEEANAPYLIGVRKSWNSWNTSNLYEGERSALTNFEDVFIRKFVEGTFPRLFQSQIIIKRRHNVVYIGGLVFQGISARKMYFLVGYTEELLSYFLKCPVKMEIQTVASRKDVVFKYI
ncbi:small ribosomal subunit protein uS3m-like isoform X2 [Lineus longissimus]|uniref:small ribosomal subunit protein uS3m-like isoform X2 n=1 Tax=Lineus longissimus TaxID=88925 RepID=UPI00315D814B